MVLMGKTEGKRPFGKPSCRREDNFTMDLQEVGWGGALYWIDLAQVKWPELVNAAMNFRVP
jgi:hypothetical protein